MLFGIWNYHFGTPFFHSSSSLNFNVFWTLNHHFFSSSLSGMPYFLVQHFSILGLSIFWDIKKPFFQLFGHFMSTHLWVDVECPIFFLVRHFSILGLSIFFTFCGYLNFFFQLFGHFVSTRVWVDAECPIFFGPTFFYFGTQYFWEY